MLTRLVTLAILLFGAYLLLTKALPLLTGRSGGRPLSDQETTVDSEDGRCVDRAERANDRLVSAAHEYGQPPVDVDAWSNSMWEIESQLQTAASACMCASEACRAATEAVDEMRQLLTNLDGMVRGDSPGFANPANQQERIYRHLDAARAAAGT